MIADIEFNARYYYPELGKCGFFPSTQGDTKRTFTVTASWFTTE